MGNIFQDAVGPAKSVADYASEYDQQDLRRESLVGARRQNALLALTAQQQVDATRAAMEDRNALSGIASQWNASTAPDARIAALRNSGRPALMQQADALEKQWLDRQKTEADVGKVKAETGKVASETADAAVKRFRGALEFIDTPQGAARWLQAQYADPVLGQHMQAMGPIQQAIAQIPSDPQGYQAWRQQAAMGMENYTKKLQEDQKIAETGRSNRANEGISVDNNKRTVGASMYGHQVAAGNAANRLEFDREQAGKGVIHDTDAGTALIDPRTGVARLVTNPGTGEPLGPKLKDIPAGTNAAIIANNQNLQKAQQALALLEGKNVGAMAGDKAATGFKGMLPAPVLNRVDPQGVDTRAAIADLGSVVLHDRSGAAVTASEYPRLQPFIPTATDDADTAAKKLRRFIQVYQSEQQALNDTYSKAQGYKPSPVVSSPAPQQLQGGLPPMSAIDAEIARRAKQGK